MEQLNYGARTDVGKVRTHNEDCFRSLPELSFWAVLDGMGGHEGGEVASALAADLIVEKIKAGDSLTDPIAASHHAIIQASTEGKGPKGMGTTIVALKVIDHKYEIAWVGDCRAYLWDGKDLTQLTRDHSYVQYLVDEGIVAAEDAESHKHQNFIMQALGATELDDVRVDTIDNVLYQGEQILLCSDGLNKELTDPEIAEFLKLEMTEQEKVDILTETSVKNGGRDNITIVLVSADENAPVKRSKGISLKNLFEKLNARIESILKFLNS